MNHTRNHYVLVAAAFLLAGASFVYTANRVDSIPPPPADVRVSPAEWPGLLPAQLTALEADLRALGSNEVTVWCASANCASLAEDLQYAAYQADWATHSGEPFASEPGISVTPDGPAGKGLAAALSKALGVPVPVAPGYVGIAPGLHIAMGPKS